MRTDHSGASLPQRPCEPHGEGLLGTELMVLLPADGAAPPLAAAPGQWCSQAGAVGVVESGTPRSIVLTFELSDGLGGSFKADLP